MRDTSTIGHVGFASCVEKFNQSDHFNNYGPNYPLKLFDFVPRHEPRSLHAGFRYKARIIYQS